MPAQGSLVKGGWTGLPDVRQRREVELRSCDIGFKGSFPVSGDQRFGVPQTSANGRDDRTSRDGLTEARP